MNRRNFFVRLFGGAVAALGVRRFADGGIVPDGMQVLIHTHVLPLKIAYGQFRPLRPPDLYRDSISVDGKPLPAGTWGTT